jgi:fucose permease
VAFLNVIELIMAGLVFVIAQAGGAIFPSLIGLIASRAGVKVLQPIIAGLIVLMGVRIVFRYISTSSRIP